MRPYGEKGPHDKIAGGAYATRQLERRPAPATTAAPIPYALATVDNQSLSTALTDVDFSSLNDHSDGTLWDLTGGDVRVLTHGFYVVELIFSGFTIVANKDTVLQVELNIASGTVGDWSAKQHSGSAAEIVAIELLRLNRTTTSHDVSTVAAPTARSYFALNSGGTFPSVLRVQAVVYEDEVETSHTCDAKLFIAQLGAYHS